MEPLLPCPFCGATASCNWDGSVASYVVRCSNAGAGASPGFGGDCALELDGYDSELAAIADWNRRAPSWIGVADGLPTIMQDVLFCVQTPRASDIRFGFFDGARWATYELHGEVGRYVQDERVTHWMLLPEPPK